MNKYDFVIFYENLFMKIFYVNIFIGPESKERPIFADFEPFWLPSYRPSFAMILIRAEET